MAILLGPKWILWADPPSFLSKINLSKERVKRSIHIYRHQILEILSVRRIKWIFCLLWIGHRIHCRRVGSRQHLKERVSDRILLASTQRCMLEDVWNSSLVWWICSES